MAAALVPHVLAPAAVSEYGRQRWCFAGYNVPTVMLIGAMKAGTSSLSQELHDVFDIWAQRGVTHRLYETHFFDKPENQDNPTMLSYVSRFGTCGHNRTELSVSAIDYTPKYIRAPAVPKLIAHMYGHALSRKLRFVLSVRNPTTRVQSWFYQIVRARVRPALATQRHRSQHSLLSRGHPRPCGAQLASSAARRQHQQHHGAEDRPHLNRFVALTMEACRQCARRSHTPLDSDAIWLMPCSAHGLGGGNLQALQGGLYAPQLKHWLSTFDASQFLIISFAGFIADPATVRQDLVSFVLGHGAKPPAISVAAAHENAHEAVEVLSAESRQQLDHFFDPFNNALIRIMRRSHINHDRRRSSLRISPYRTPSIHNYLAG